MLASWSHEGVVFLDFLQFPHLVTSRLSSSLIWAQLTLFVPAWGTRSPSLQDGIPIHRVHGPAHSLTGIQNTNSKFSHSSYFLPSLVTRWVVYEKLPKTCGILQVGPMQKSWRIPLTVITCHKSVNAKVRQNVGDKRNGGLHLRLLFHNPSKIFWPQSPHI